MLSIIIPCFNSVGTLRETVESIDFSNIPIPTEVIFIDDASTDGTAQLIQKLAATLPKSQVLSHDYNRGGGAARNTGVKYAKGDLFFCLDSDDILPEGMLAKLISLLLAKRAQGVVFGETRYFFRMPILHRSWKNNFFTKRKIVFSDLFTDEQSFFTQVNFLFSLQGYRNAGPYPEHHGFDTQEFGFKFLANSKNTVYMCPNSYYYHRHDYGTSYFVREYEKGKFSLNYYLILEQVLYKFSPTMVMKIMDFDIFANCHLDGDNLAKLLKSEFKKEGNKIFSIYDSWSSCINSIKKKKQLNQGNQIIMAVSALQSGDFKLAERLVTAIIKHHKLTPLLSLLQTRVKMRMEGLSSKNNEACLTSNSLRPFVSIYSRPFLIRAMLYLKSL